MEQLNLIQSYSLYLKLCWKFFRFADKFNEISKLRLNHGETPWYEGIPQFGDVMLKEAGIEIIVQNHFPQNHTKKFVIMANHGSFLDLFLMAKASAGQPVTACMADWAYQLMESVFEPFGAIPLKRNRSPEDIQRIQHAYHRIKENGINVICLPEGTRSLTQTQGLLPFKKGGFHIAQELDYDILPIYIIGAKEAKPKDRHTFIRQRVTIVYGEPLDISSYTITEAVKYVRTIMRRNYFDLRQQHLAHA